MNVKEKRRLEFAVRAKRLTEFGYADYAEYIRGKHWKLTRSAYFAHPDAPKRCFCGESDERCLVLHHKTYVRIGAEDLRDLHPLCLTCHSDVHLIAKRGLMPFDLDDYASADRKQRYAEEWTKRTPDGQSVFEEPFKEHNWKRGAQERHLGAEDRRKRARRIAARARRAA